MAHKHRLLKRMPRARDRAWQSMRMLRRFCLRDLQATAEISYDNIKKYVRGLERSGYLRRVGRYESGRKGSHITWLLVRDTGPYAPRMQSDGSTYDPNLHKVIEGGIKQCRTG